MFKTTAQGIVWDIEKGPIRTEAWSQQGKGVTDQGLVALKKGTRCLGTLGYLSMNDRPVKCHSLLARVDVY